MSDKASTEGRPPQEAFPQGAWGGGLHLAVPGRAQIKAPFRKLTVRLAAASLLTLCAASAATGLFAASAAAFPTPSTPVVTNRLHDGAPTDFPNRAQPARNDRATTNTATAVPARNMDSLDDKQKLAIGDRVTFRVVEDQEDPRNLTVTDAGELDVPELGLVNAVGKTCKQLAFEIKKKLEQVTYYHATVIIGLDLLNKTTSGRKVYVVGQVRVTGPQDIPAGETMTVSRAIMKAGGFTDFADGKRVRLVRGGTKGQPGQTFTVNIVEVLKGRTDKDLSVEPEDLIYVPSRAVNIF